MKDITLHKRPETPRLNFNLPDELQCGLPTEERGLARDAVRLMVSDKTTDQISHTHFHALDQYLKAGDVLVINTSGTLKAALEANLLDGTKIRIHFSTRMDAQHWVVELRQVNGQSNQRYFGGKSGQVLTLPNGGTLQLLKPYYSDNTLDSNKKHLQLWESYLDLPIPIEDYLDHFGKPIKYQYLKTSYPAAYYQTIFATQMGSAEMPSAGRAFTPELITRLIAKGVQILPVLLHTGVASLEISDRPYDEFFEVTPTTAESLNLARKSGRRIIAVGTTVVRALESAIQSNGTFQATSGWTNVIVTPQKGAPSVDGLLTGFHEPKASHLLMLEAIAGRPHLKLAYQEAIRTKYLWHEFGDLHLIL